MSSDSMTTRSSRLDQFGLYKTIDATTEEFLRLSRKRQIRQGCACAAVSTAITVTVVVVILLIYEYAISVEYSIVQKIRSAHSNSNGTYTDDHPVADRLDRSYFGFDQDYFEQMPLLVNAMQENSYVDPTADTLDASSKARNLRPASTTKKYPSTLTNKNMASIRRTSPRPFLFEYKSPAPLPFRKSSSSQTWVESYRNAQRMENLQQVIKYLEKTINAKFGDLYTLPSTHIAFSGVYVDPGKNADTKSTTPIIDLLLQGSKSEKYNSNHKFDPLYTYKPESPGDVNMLADGFLRFSPIPTPSLPKETSSPKIPMFRPIKQRRKYCVGNICDDLRNNKSYNFSPEPSDIKSTKISPADNLFSLMLNVIPLQTGNIRESYKNIDLTENPNNISPSNVYFTTTRPLIQFRRKVTYPIRRKSIRIKVPRMYPSRNPNLQSTNIQNIIPIHSDKNTENNNATTKVILHVNIYNFNRTRNFTESVDDTMFSTPESSTQRSIDYTITPMPSLTSSQVEDYHPGSSGIIPLEQRTTPALPHVTEIVPFFDTTTDISRINTWSTTAPEVYKFSHEDAKIPDEYLRRTDAENIDIRPTEISRRNFGENLNVDEDLNEPKTISYKPPTTETTTEYNYTDYNDNEDNKTNTFSDFDDKEQTDETEVTTTKTYVPQINGHYRSVNQNSRNINSWLNAYKESNRKKRIEMNVSGFRSNTYVPSYVEIKRNKTRSSEEREDT